MASRPVLSPTCVMDHVSKIHQMIDCSITATYNSNVSFGDSQAVFAANIIYDGVWIELLDRITDVLFSVVDDLVRPKGSAHELGISTRTCGQYLPTTLFSNLNTVYTASGTPAQDNDTFGLSAFNIWRYRFN